MRMILNLYRNIGILLSLFLHAVRDELTLLLSRAAHKYLHTTFMYLFLLLYAKHCKFSNMNEDNLNLFHNSIFLYGGRSAKGTQRRTFFGVGRWVFDELPELLSCH
jgi:hypothetical protein